MGTKNALKKQIQKTHTRCRRCGRTSFHIQKKVCSGCGYPSARLRHYNWCKKMIRRKTRGTGRMRYEKELPRKAKNGFREQVRVVVPHLRASGCCGRTRRLVGLASRRPRPRNRARACRGSTFRPGSGFQQPTSILNLPPLLALADRCAAAEEGGGLGVCFGVLWPLAVWSLLSAPLGGMGPLLRGWPCARTRGCGPLGAFTRRRRLAPIGIDVLLAYLNQYILWLWGVC